LKYLALLSSSFSGSTLLSILLSQDKRVIGFGDTYPLDSIEKRNGYADMTCTCGELILQCPLRVTLQEKMREKGFRNYSWLTSRATPRLLGKAPRRLRLLQMLPNATMPAVFGRFLSETDAYIAALSEIGDFQVYFDGCKTLIRHEILSRSNRDMKIVHLLKDPRDVVHSYLKHSGKSDHAVEGFVRQWIFYNDTAYAYRHRLGDANYLPITYSELVRSPEDSLRKIYQFAGLPAPQIDLSDINLNWLHIVGNKMRSSFINIEDRSGEWVGRLDKNVADEIVRKVAQYEWGKLAFVEK
jgi:hypothetical protein